VTALKIAMDYGGFTDSSSSMMAGLLIIAVDAKSSKETELTYGDSSSNIASFNGMLDPIETEGAGRIHQPITGTSIARGNG
jgi:hypothetical protein